MARSVWMPPTLIHNNFVKSHLKYRWWKSASDAPLRSPECVHGISMDPLPFELGDVFVHRSPNPIQQTWIFLPDGWKDISASFYMDHGTISHPLYPNRILIRHNAVGDPSFIFRDSFKGFRKRKDTTLKKRQQLE
jgi:hypothetical protein